VRRGVAAAFLGALVAGVVDQDLAEGLGRDLEEVPAPVPAPVGHVDQLEISLMDEGGRLERVLGVRRAEEARRQGAQLVVDERQEFSRSPGASGLGFLQQLGHLRGLALGFHHSLRSKSGTSFNYIRKNAPFVAPSVSFPCVVE